jgi:hypothetical protein
MLHFWLHFVAFHEAKRHLWSNVQQMARNRNYEMKLQHHLWSRKPEHYSTDGATVLFNIFLTLAE